MDDGEDEDAPDERRLKDAVQIYTMGENEIVCNRAFEFVRSYLLRDDLEWSEDLMLWNNN